MRATLPFNAQENCLPSAVPSALESTHPSPSVHLTPVLFECLPLLFLGLSPLPGSAWPHHRRGVLHLPDEFHPRLWVGSRGCQARGQQEWGRRTFSCGATPHIRYGGSHESSTLGNWLRERNTCLYADFDIGSCRLLPPLRCAQAPGPPSGLSLPPCLE